MERSAPGRKSMDVWSAVLVWTGLSLLGWGLVGLVLKAI